MSRHRISEDGQETRCVEFYISATDDSFFTGPELSTWRNRVLRTEIADQCQALLGYVPSFSGIRGIPQPRGQHPVSVAMIFDILEHQAYLFKLIAADSLLDPAIWGLANSFLTRSD